MDKPLKFASIALALSFAVLNITLNPFARVNSSEGTCSGAQPGSGCNCCYESGTWSWTCSSGSSANSSATGSCTL